MSDTEKLAEAMKELAAAIKELSAKIPASNGSGSGIMIYHQHSYPSLPQPSWQYYNPYTNTGGGNLI